MKFNKSVVGLSLLLVLVFLFYSPCVLAMDYSAENGVTFTIPEGWKEEPLSEDREHIKVKYVPVEDNGAVIVFGYTDIWEALPESEKNGYTRADFNNSTFSKSDIAESFATTADKVSMVTVNEIEYYKCSVLQNVTVSNQSLNIDMLVFVAVRDGILYQFQYFEIDTDKNYYRDFETLLNSVVYPTLLNNDSTPGNSYIPTSTQAQESSLMDFSLGNILLSLLLTITIYTIPVLILRYSILKKPVETKKAKTITIIYAIVAFIIMAVIVSLISEGGETASGGGLFLWSFVNYKILIGGSDNTKIENSQDTESKNFSRH